MLFKTYRTYVEHTHTKKLNKNNWINNKYILKKVGNQTILVIIIIIIMLRKKK